jgi:enoyl-CoA hydratase
MQLQTVSLEKKEAIAIVTINRPPLNVLNSKMLTELEETIEKLETEKAKVVVITGTGNSFVGGADIKEMKDKDTLSAYEFSKLGQKVVTKIENLSQPVVGAINGFALGGGLELALGCDILIASENAKFGHPEVGLGIIPGWGSTQRLARAVGIYKAKDLTLTGKIIDAKEAYRIGLVSKVVKVEDLMKEVNDLATQISHNAPVAVKLSKRLLNQSFSTSLESGLLSESTAFGFCFSTQDQKEGMQAFVEKRKPRFKGR